MKTHSQVTMTLGEENELKFACSIKGLSSDSTSSPKFRFLISEKGNPQGLSLALPAQQVSEGKLSVRVPNLDLFEEGKDYEGILEVIVGTRIFNPIALPMIFEQPVQVEAAQILNESETVAQVESVIKPPPPMPPEPPKKAFNPVSEKVALGVLFTERREPPKPVPVAPKVIPATPEFLAAKKQLKRMLEEAWGSGG